ncbi:MAG: hypothetical protein HY513_02975 [Candidatus Aenigmarchaeota archaeon]|nr:hypothetical protein [Candidatus Aenigmarchaeota archaeon]
MVEVARSYSRELKRARAAVFSSDLNMMLGRYAARYSSSQDGCDQWFAYRTRGDEVPVLLIPSGLRRGSFMLADENDAAFFYRQVK